jgi:hypothetical protein
MLYLAFCQYSPVMLSTFGSGKTGTKPRLYCAQSLLGVSCFNPVAATERSPRPGSEVDLMPQPSDIATLSPVCALRTSST